MLSLANTSNKFDIRNLGDSPQWPVNPTSANDWFQKKFPAHIQVFGSPFLEQRQPGQYGEDYITPLIPNLDCLAACLGGDEKLGHRVIFYVQELQFYFYDPRDQQFHATTDQKLGNLLRGLLARCAAEVKGEGHLLNIFHTFRSDSVVKAVINRCKSLLAADPDFFGVNSSHQRVAGPELHQRLAMVFAQRLLEVHEGSQLTIGQTYAFFNRFAREKELLPMKRSQFKAMMADVIREQFGLGLRNDLIDVQTQKQGCGWKGLRIVEENPPS
jgi:hypothetical protein